MNFERKVIEEEESKKEEKVSIKQKVKIWKRLTEGQTSENGNIIETPLDRVEAIESAMDEQEVMAGERKKEKEKFSLARDFPQRAINSAKMFDEDESNKNEFKKSKKDRSRENVPDAQ